MRCSAPGPAVQSGDEREPGHTQPGGPQRAYSTGGRRRRRQGRSDGGGGFDGHHADRHPHVGAGLAELEGHPGSNADAGGREVHEGGAFIDDR